MLLVVLGLLVGAFIGTVAGGLLSWQLLSQRQAEALPLDYLLTAAAVRRRFELGQFKAELRRDAADARRALRAELNALDKRGVVR